MWWILSHIHLLGVLIAVHIDVDDVLAFAEAGAVEGDVADAGRAVLFSTFIDITQAICHKCRHLGVVVGVVMDGHQTAAVILREVVGEAVLTTALRITVLIG